MFILEFLSNLPQPLGDNPWSINLINRNFRTQFHRQCAYLLGFQKPKKIDDSILKRKWLRNNLHVEDDPYETLIFAYNKEMDQQVVTHHYTKMCPSSF